MTDATGLTPVSRTARIDAIDVLRGIAILGIFYMNVPYMASNVVLLDNDVRSVGWTLIDQSVWVVVQILLEGTKRGLLELLFGAGMMVLAAKAMTPDGPVATADLYYRRNLWLLAFGLFDIFVLLWPGDILHIYALAALFLFPFRTLAPKWLVAIGLSFALLTAALGAADYAERADLASAVQTIEARQQAGVAPDAEARATLTDWRKVVDARKIDADEKKKLETEVAARSPGASLETYGWFMWQEWIGFAGWRWTVGTIVEAFCMMLIGVALWKWGIIQGARSARFYAGLAAASYAVGFTIRGIGVTETFAFSTSPKQSGQRGNSGASPSRSAMSALSICCLRAQRARACSHRSRRRGAPLSRSTSCSKLSASSSCSRRSASAGLRASAGLIWR